MFRTEPNSLEEMLAWGMISIKLYNMHSNMEFEAAQAEILRHWGLQTWSFGVSHIMEYVAKSKVDVGSFTRNEWAGHCLKLANGKMCPNIPTVVYNIIVPNGRN